MCVVLLQTLKSPKISVYRGVYCTLKSADSLMSPGHDLIDNWELATSLKFFIYWSLNTLHITSNNGIIDNDKTSSLNVLNGWSDWTFKVPFFFFFFVNEMWVMYFYGFKRFSWTLNLVIVKLQSISWQKKLWLHSLTFSNTLLLSLKINIVKKMLHGCKKILLKKSKSKKCLDFFLFYNTAKT